MKENLGLYMSTNVIKKVEAYAKDEDRSKSNAVERLLEIAFRTLAENK